MTTASPWRDVNGAAARAGVSKPTILRAARRGELRGFKIGGRKLWRFRDQDVDDWVMRSTQPTPFMAARSKRG